MKSITTSALFLFLAHSLIATGITFNAEVDQVILDGEPINHSEAATNNLKALGFFVSSANFASFTSNDVWAGNESSITTATFSNVLSFLNSNGLDSASSVAASPLTFLPVFTGAIDSGTAGNHAVFIIHDGADLASLSEGNNLGVVTTTFQTLAQGNPAVGFTGSSTWDTTLLGTPGSIGLAGITVVPEPSAYGLLSGILVICWVMIRRRRD